MSTEIDPTCPKGYIFDKATCQCVLDTKPDEVDPYCPAGWFFNTALCQCEQALPPPPPIAFRFNVSGDYRDTPESGDNIISDKPDIIFSTGDYGIKTNNADEWCNQVMKMWKDSKIPTWGLIGNHDNDTYLKTGFFQNTSWEWTVKKSMIGFIACNTVSENVTDADTRLQELQNDPNIKFIIVFMHEPIYHPKVGTSVTSDTTLEFHNTFKKYSKVRMVICGHTHVFAMSLPIDNILYVINGIGGQSPSSGSTTPGPFHKINGALHCSVSKDGSIKCDCIPNKDDAPATMWSFTIGPNGELPTNGVEFERRE